MVEVDVTRGVRTRFVFHTTAAHEVFSVLLQVTSGSATVVVSLDGAELLRHIEATPSTDELGNHLVGKVTASGPGDFDVVLTGAGHARLEIYEPTSPSEPPWASPAA